MTRAEFVELLFDNIVSAVDADQAGTSNDGAIEVVMGDGSVFLITVTEGDPL